MHVCETRYLRCDAHRFAYKCKCYLSLVSRSIYYAIARRIIVNQDAVGVEAGVDTGVDAQASVDAGVEASVEAVPDKPSGSACDDPGNAAGRVVEDYLGRIHEAMVESGNDVDYYDALQRLAVRMARQPLTY